ncbi:ammonium transporter Rh type A isoform X3 [Fopius arisanus]|uniref:Ammonium transporter Rh type A isoform X3 n=1 Tax=Fopius arisanus TaxID=64838 RepID=A0A9R1U7N9_9HYME|nr:PREDICTED: ammonium transporter Rh type A isoform X3 [Fopius arisanus]
MAQSRYEWVEKRQIFQLIAVEVIVMVLMGLFLSYGPDASGISPPPKQSPLVQGKTSRSYVYPMYQDVHVMIWIGFGFLMTFPKRYGQSALGLTFLVGAILIQVAIICEGVINITKSGKAPLSLMSLLNADVAVAAPLISMGALLGKTTYMQLIFMGIIELVVFTLNKYLGEEYLMAADAGGSMFVHVFGAYFGLAVSFAFGIKRRPKEHHLEGSSYHSDIFAMIDMMCEPIGALLIGSSAGAISVLGYKYLTPMIQNRLRIHDTCGVHNLHGMPGVLAGVFGALMAGMATEVSYKESLYQVFPARAPSTGDESAELRVYSGIHAGHDRTAGQQAGYQLLALGITLGNAIVSGVITGMILRTDICGTVPEASKFDDALHFELEDDVEQDLPMKIPEGNSSRIVEQISMSHI